VATEVDDQYDVDDLSLLPTLQAIDNAVPQLATGDMKFLLPCYYAGKDVCG